MTKQDPPANKRDPSISADSLNVPRMVNLRHSTAQHMFTASTPTHTQRHARKFGEIDLLLCVRIIVNEFHGSSLHCVLLVWVS
jgi:hypothetical protein